MGGEQSPHTTQKAPALKLVSFLPSMCRHWRAWITCPLTSSRHSSGVGQPTVVAFFPLLSSPLPRVFFFSLSSLAPLLLSYAWFGSVSRLSGGSGSDAPMSQEASVGAACSTAHASSAYGEQRSLCFALPALLSLHSFIPLPLSLPLSMSLSLNMLLLPSTPLTGCCAAPVCL